MPSNPDPSDTDEPIDKFLDFERRPVLKALGAGAALSLGSGAATAGGDDDEDGEETEAETDEADDDTDGVEAEETDTREIHPAFGLPLAEGEPVPDDIDPAQVVELDVEEEENIHENFPLQPDPENPEQFVEVPQEFVFDPVGLHLDPGDVVHFDNVAHLHTVTSFHEKFGEEMFPMPTRIPETATGFSSPPFVGGESWLYEFTEEGVYDILCLPHLGFGMVLRVVVGDVETLPEELAEFTEAVPPNAQTVLSAPELDPQNIVENETVGWRDLTLEGAPTGETAPTEEEAGTQTGEEETEPEGDGNPTGEEETEPEGDGTQPGENETQPDDERRDEEQRRRRFGGL